MRIQSLVLSIMLLVRPTMGALPVIPRRAMSGLRGGATLGGPPPLIICGPSGVGKSTLIKETLFVSPPPTNRTFAFSVSHTTRRPRAGEVDGVDYHFVDRPSMDELLRKSPPFFVEHAEVHGKLYGTSFAAVEAVKNQDKVCVLDIDVQGVKTLKLRQLSTPQTASLFANSKFVFLTPKGGVSLLEQRLKGRGTEAPGERELRVRSAEAEIEYGTEAGNFDLVLEMDEGDNMERRREFLEFVEANYRR